MANSSRPWTEPLAVGERRALAHWLSALAPHVRRAVELGTVALIGAWIGFYLLTTLPYIDLHAFKSTVVLHAVTGIVVIPYLITLVLGRRLPGGSALDAPVVALVGAYLLATVLSEDWRVSLEVSLTALLGVGAFYVLSDGRLFRRWQLELALMLAAFAAACDALWVTGTDYADWLQLTHAVSGGIGLGDLIPPTVPRVHDVGDHENIVGGVLATTLPFFLVGTVRSWGVPLRVAAVLSAAVVVLAMFLTLSRSAWLGAATGGLTAATLLLVATPGGLDLLRRLRPETPARRAALAVVLVGAVLLLVAGILFAVQSVEARPQWLFRPSDSPRWDVMGAGAEMVSDHPVTGSGPGTFGLLYPEYSGKHPITAIHAHNGYLQTAVDLGAPGVLAMLGLALATGWLIWRGLRETEGAARLSVIACAGAFVAFGTFSLFEAPNGFKSTLVTLGALGALLVLSLREGGATLTPKARPARVALLGARVLVPLALAGLLISWARLDAGHYYYSNAVSNANAGRWNAALDEMDRAVALDPEFAIYRLALGTIEGQAYLATADPVRLEDALTQLRRTVELEPRSAIAHANLALLLAKSADYAGAREEALAAVRFANSDPAVLLAAGTALEQSNQGEEAVDAYARVISIDRRLADSSFWSATPFRETRFTDVLERSSLDFDPCQQLSLALAGSAPAGAIDRDGAFVRCQERVAARPNELRSRVALAEALLADGDRAGARRHLNVVLARRPDDGEARTVLGRWYFAQGDLDGARREWLRAGELDDVDGLVLLGDSYPAGEVPSEVVDALRARLGQAQSEVQFHLTGILYYRFKFYRGSPITILLPGDWQQAVPGVYARARDALDRWTAPE